MCVVCVVEGRAELRLLGGKVDGGSQGGRERRKEGTSRQRQSNDSDY